MKTRFFCMALLLFAGPHLLASAVSEAAASRAASHWVALGGAMEMGLDAEVREIRKRQLADGGGSFYVARFEGGGFAVLSTDDRLEPVLAFSTADDLEESARNPLWCLLRRDVAARTKSLSPSPSLRPAATRAATAAESAAQAKWSMLLAGTTASAPRGEGASALSGLSSISDVRVSPLVQSKWNQEGVGRKTCYNFYTPGNVCCGCVATMTAQLMRYWRYPTSSVAPRTVTCSYEGEEMELTMKGGVYDWASMPLVPSSNITDAQREAIGRLTYDAGVSCAMQYSSQGSGASVFAHAVQLPSVFGYADARAFCYDVDGSLSQWGFQPFSLATFQPAVLANLDAGLPVGLGITDGAYGHAILVDGYGYSGGTLYVHANLGWSGYHDLWYAPPDIEDYTAIDGILYQVSPSNVCAIASGRVLDESGEPISGAVVTISYNSTSYGTVTTGDKGMFAFQVPVGGRTTDSKLSQRTYSISASADGYEGVQRNVVVSNNVSPRLEPDGAMYTVRTPQVGNSWGNELVLAATQTETRTTEVPVPHAWLDGYGLVSGGDYESAALADVDGDGYAAWQEFVAGSDPTNSLSRLRALIGVTNNVVRLSWEPDLGASRVYTVLGKSALSDASWASPTNALHRFYKVRVELP